MAIYACKIITLGGTPAPEILEEVASILMSPFLRFKPRIYRGPVLSIETGLAPLHERLLEFPNFTARGNQKFEAFFDWNNRVGVNPPITGSLGVFIKALKTIEVDELVAMVAELVELLQAPMGFVDIAGDNYRVRQARHRDIYQEGRVGIDRRFGFHVGFSGIPWRTVFGPEFVNYFDSDLLKSLPANLAQPIRDDVWLLKPCEYIDEWDANEWCDGEAKIIERLGIEHFFDPQTETVARKGVKIFTKCH